MKTNVNTEFPKKQRDDGKVPLNPTSSLVESVEILGQYETIFGSIVQIPLGEAANYAGVRAEQLSALLQLMIPPEFQEDFTPKFRNSMTILAMSFAKEIEDLLAMVDQEARLDEKGGTQ